MSSHSWPRDIVRSVLPKQRRKRTGQLLSGNFAFHLEIKVPESGGRVERHRIQVAWSPVWSFHSQWWFGVPCHLLVLVHCVLSSPESMQPSTRRFKSTSCFHLLTSFMEMLISFSSRIWHLPTVPKWLVTGFLPMVLLCLIGQPTGLIWSDLLSRGNEIHQNQQYRRAVGHHQSKPGFHNTSAVPQADCLPVTPHWCSHLCLTKYWVHKWTCFFVFWVN